MELLFWISAGFVIYIYAGYPLAVAALGRLRPRPVRAAPGDDRSVTVVIAAFNEAAHIEATVRNKLELDYSPDKLDVIVVSDESMDGTDDIVQGLAQEFPGRVRLIRQAPRNGKTSGLNLAIPEARGEIVVFSDANSIYQPDALRVLLNNFADPDVGYVTGHMVYGVTGDSAAGQGSSGFMKYENFLRGCETRVGSVVGVDGGIDAIRRDLYQPMRADQLPDFVLPLTVAERGHRVVYEPRAVLEEDGLRDTADEYRMRVRVSLRALWALFDRRAILNPFRYGIYAWQVWSHKVFRYLAFIPMLAALIANALLVARGAPFVYSVLLAGQIAFYGLAVCGRILERTGIGSGLLTAPYYFMVVNVAAAHAFVRFLLRQKQTIWKPRAG